MDTCILENISQLDSQSFKEIEKKELQQDNYEERAEQLRISQELQEPPNADRLPEWWTFPELKITLSEACDSMKNLLNNDHYSTERRALITNELEEVTGILQTCVAEVGPSGLFLRARVENVDEQGQDRYDTIEVPIKFPIKAGTADDLRSSVLKVVEAAETAEQERLVAETPEHMEETPPPQKPEAEEELSPAAADSIAISTGKIIEEREQEKIKPREDGGKPSTADIIEARKQPKSPEEEARLAQKYAAIEDLGERAYTVLQDLYMI